MAAVRLRRCALLMALLAAGVAAVDPSPGDRQKWDDKCKAKRGNMYAMVFDSAGKPTGTCRAPPYKGCYWGPYVDPKTGDEGCCEKGNGEFSTDPVATLEGGCCTGKLKFSFDTNAGKGGCCDDGDHMSWDLSLNPPLADGLCCPAGQVASTDRVTNLNHCCPSGLTYSSHPSGAGDCCAPGETFSYNDVAKKGDCCASGASFQVDPLTGKGSCCATGDSFACDCKCVPGAGSGTGGGPDPGTGTGSGGQQDGGNGGDGNDGNEGIDDKDEDIGDPKTCPDVGGRTVDVGGVTYEIQCKFGITARFADYRAITTTDVGECMAACSADPKCQGANLYDEGADDGCVMVQEWEYPASGTVDPGDNLMSLVPTKKR